MTEKKFAVLTDSACDLPYDLAKARGVDILNFGITVDGTGYYERVDFDFDEYYGMLRNCEDVPATAHITVPRFEEAFENYAQAGVEEVLYVSICRAGSATHDAAVTAAARYAEKHPQSGMRIHVVDSHAYSMAYGWFVAEAARKLAEGEAMDAIVAWLTDIFARAEILLAAFSLRFMKKSGRISAAAAFAGELLGLRPVITLNDGISTVQQKVRGDKDVAPAMVAYADAHRQPDTDYMVGGTDHPRLAELVELCTRRFGKPPLCTFRLGAAVSTNTGPDAIAMIYLGEKRTRD